jgi:hypothetical protein
MPGGPLLPPAPHLLPCWPPLLPPLRPACLQKDTFKQDAVFFCGVLLLFYALVQAWTGLFSGSSGLSGF